ncbi:SPOR domain-containing protein [Pseudoxanthomonas sp. CF125]|uniref:SPOR domain-containing protein n=1 Tax=Pseudoxanthomonas sp. CF125 TaxID=1855303 RepID=UPI00088E1959|nr:SPOR domain-containing protein [Pseudoxanthomonas sp. CF125]SDR21467.1 Cell division protein DedD (protein involved in septation) [Pseudoxanthomonas sp. CF125]
MDTALKQRLIGAVVLVALAVIFLPMLIKGPAPDSGVSDVPLEVPATPGGQYETRELPLVAPGNAPAGGVVGLDEKPAAAPASASEAVPLGTAPAPAAGVMLPASTAGGNYAVNFGAYATPADADAVIARLKQSSLQAFREPATINGKTAYRVRIGPYAERADAEAVRLQASQVRSDVKAQVVTLDAAPATAPASTSVPLAATAPPVTTQTLPESPKPAQTPPAATPKPVATAPKPAVVTPKPAEPVAKPAETPKPAAANVGFAVQLGAFSKAADANALRDKLRAGGFSAFVEQVKTDKGTLSRVRVGPVASRADADKLKAQVAAKVGINGMVRPHP